MVVWSKCHFAWKMINGKTRYQIALKDYNRSVLGLYTFQSRVGWFLLGSIRSLLVFVLSDQKCVVLSMLQHRQFSQCWSFPNINSNTFTKQAFSSLLPGLAKAGNDLSDQPSPTQPHPKPAQRGNRMLENCFIHADFYQWMALKRPNIKWQIY